MTKVELKGLVLDKIYLLEDEKILEKINSILDKEVVYNLTNEQKEMIREGREQYGRGEYVTNEEVEKDEDEWLKE